jgi:cell division protein ZapA
MAKRTQAVSVSILGKEYKIACEEDEVEALLESAKDLDRQMRTIRDSGAVASPDRIAVMAALNLTHEVRQARLAQKKEMNASVPEGFAQTLAKLRKRIENILEND